MLRREFLKGSTAVIVASVVGIPLAHGALVEDDPIKYEVFQSDLLEYGRLQHMKVPGQIHVNHFISRRLRQIRMEYGPFRVVMDHVINLVSHDGKPRKHYLGGMSLLYMADEVVERKATGERVIKSKFTSYASRYHHSKAIRIKV